MAIPNFFNLARMAVASAPGTGTASLSVAAPGGFLSFDDAGVTTGQLVSYACFDGNNREVGTGIYTTSGKTLTRTVTIASVNGTKQTTPITATAAAIFFITARAEDLTSAISGLVPKLSFVTSSGTWTPTAGMVYTLVKAQAGGGQGGGIAGNGASTADSGSGGGAGELSISLLTAATIGASKAITIGGGGSAGGFGAVGATGGDTSFGSLVIAKGGIGGANVGFTYGSYGNGGASGTGNISCPGMNGGPGMYIHQGGCIIPSGFGGHSPYGRGGRPTFGNTTAVNGESATGYGAGGSGASVSGDSSTGQGGYGSGGCMEIMEYLQP